MKIIIAIAVVVFFALLQICIIVHLFDKHEAKLLIKNFSKLKKLYPPIVK